MAKKILGFLIVSLIFVVNLSAQKTQYYQSNFNEFRRGLELFDKEKYGAAQKVFTQFIDDVNDPTNEASVNAEYYVALCGVYLFNRDADFLLREFIRKYPESYNVARAHHQLGIFNYRKRKWKKALHWFKQVDPFQLEQEDYHDFVFKYGYALFEEDEFEKASQKFFELKDVDNPYSAPAKYYFAHIAYQDEKNQTALDEFRKLEGHEQFGPVVPFYISQLLFKQKKFDELIEYAPPLLNNKNTKRAEEISRLLGESYFGKADYENAIPYLKEYQKKARGNSATDRYQLAFCYYQTEQYDNAIPLFSKLSGYEDELGQTSLYQLADCYLKTKNKQAARNAFLEVYKMGIDPKLTEDGLFNYAKLSYDLQFDPYNKAIKAFNKYIEEYPTSSRLDEAYNYLTNLYLTSRNYNEALAAIEKIKNLDLSLQKAYQTIAVNKAIEEFQNRKFEESLKYFKLSKKYPVDKNKNTLTQYWKAEANYRLKDYKKSIDDYQGYLYEPLAILQDEFPMAHYSLGYAYYKSEDFDNAASWFRKYVNYKDVTDSIRLADAYIRIGDCYFIQKKYFLAIDYYENSNNYKGLDNDYGLLQTALAQGILKQNPEKIISLEKLIANFPQSSYLDDARYQLGRSYMLANDVEKAKINFNVLVENHSTSPFVKDALSGLGLIYYNAHENDKALNIFKRVVADYPNYEDSKEALVYIKNIFVELGDVNAYADFVNNLEFVNITQASLDSTTYEAASLKYLNGDCLAATKDLTDYLDQFVPANFALNAHFYRGECLYKSEEFGKALTDYKYVADKGQSKFYETSLAKVSKIYFDQEQFKEALPYYVSLEKNAALGSNSFDATLGLMRCYYSLNKLDSAISYATKLMAQPKLDKGFYVEAQYILANAAEQNGELEQALAAFQIVSDTSESAYGAEAKFHIAEIYFKLDSFNASKTIINQIVSQVPSYDYWIAKGLILLADIFLAEGDLFQAKVTLQSIVDNYEGDPMVVEIAQTNLQKILDLEKEEKVEEEEPLEIDLGNLDYDLIDLFEEEEEVDETLPEMQKDETEKEESESEFDNN